MSLIAGIDYSTHAIDVVLLDEDSREATWRRYPLEGADAFERARVAGSRFPFMNSSRFWDDVLAVGIEDPRGYNAGALYRVQGAILARLPRSLLVYPWIPSAWRKAVGLPGNASKDAVRAWAVKTMLFSQGKTRISFDPPWPQDALDAYCIALATEQAIVKEAA